MIFQSTHQLDFESAPYEVSLLIGDDTMKFRIGTCEGLWNTSDTTYDIIAVKNSFKGNGHLQDVFDWFENSCKRDKKALRVMEIMNQKFKKHLIQKRGFREIKNTNNLIKDKF